MLGFALVFVTGFTQTECSDLGLSARAWLFPLAKLTALALLFTETRSLGTRGGRALSLERFLVRNSMRFGSLFPGITGRTESDISNIRCTTGAEQSLSCNPNIRLRPTTLVTHALSKGRFAAGADPGIRFVLKCAHTEVDVVTIFVPKVLWAVLVEVVRYFFG
jgi:hypothetical protein